MKIIIESKKLNSAIFDYINDEFISKNLDWEFAEDDDYNDGFDKNIVEFLGDAYEDDDVDNRYFTYIKKEYYENLGDSSELYYRFIDKAPLLDLNQNPFFYKLNELFGARWRPIFEEWFTQNYPYYPVKTFIYKTLDNQW